MAATTEKDTPTLPEYVYPEETSAECKYFLIKTLLRRIGILAHTAWAVEYADLEALDISKLDQPGGKEALAAQVLGFINKNGQHEHFFPCIASADPGPRVLLCDRARLFR